MKVACAKLLPRALAGSLCQGAVVRARSILRTQQEAPAKGPQWQNGAHLPTASGPFRNKGQSPLSIPEFLL